MKNLSWRLNQLRLEMEAISEEIRKQYPNCANAVQLKGAADQIKGWVKIIRKDEKTSN